MPSIVMRQWTSGGLPRRSRHTKNTLSCGAKARFRPLPPTHHQLVTTTRQTRYQDTRIEPGRRYIYTVFTKRNGLYSRVGSATEVVLTLAEVRNLTTDAGDRTVALRWQTPPNVARVLVHRGLQPPKDSTDGTVVPTVGPGYAQDTDLQNGRTYYYLVCCVYRFSDGQEVASAGLCCLVTPSAPPQPVTDFHVQAEGTRVMCTWSPMAHGQVVTGVRCTTRPALRPGALLNAEALARLGRWLPQLSPDRVEDPRSYSTGAILCRLHHRRPLGGRRSCPLLHCR